MTIGAKESRGQLHSWELAPGLVVHGQSVLCDFDRFYVGTSVQLKSLNGDMSCCCVFLVCTDCLLELSGTVHACSNASYTMLKVDCPPFCSLGLRPVMSKALHANCSPSWRVLRTTGCGPGPSSDCYIWDQELDTQRSAKLML